jgi:hypothetical protein
MAIPATNLTSLEEPTSVDLTVVVHVLDHARVPVIGAQRLHFFAAICDALSDVTFYINGVVRHEMDCRSDRTECFRIPGPQCLPARVLLSDLDVRDEERDERGEVACVDCQGVAGHQLLDPQDRPNPVQLLDRVSRHGSHLRREHVGAEVKHLCRIVPEDAGSLLVSEAFRQTLYGLS